MFCDQGGTQLEDDFVFCSSCGAKAPGKVKGKSELLFAFNTLTPKAGKAIPIVADLKGMSNSKGVADVDEEGRVIGNPSTRKDVKRTALFDAAGAVIGGIAGGGSGAAKGAAIGLTIAFSTSGPDIQIAEGSTFELTVNTRKIPAAADRASLMMEPGRLKENLCRREAHPA